MSDTPSPLRKRLTNEAAIFSGLLLVGLVILPIIIWFVGKAVFGAYGGAGFGDFFGILTGRLRSGDLVAWFLVLSPWLAVQLIRLSLAGWRLAGKM